MIRTSVAALVAVAFMGWGSSYAQFGSQNQHATEELLSIAEGWCGMQAEEGESVNEEVRRLLAAGADVNATDDFGKTVLMYAVSGWEYGTAKFLISQGANINDADGEGRTALMWALMSDGSCPAMKGSMGVDVRSVRLLLEKGANPKAVSKSGETALSLAKGDKRLSGMVQTAIDNYGSGKKMNLNTGTDAVDADGKTVLMHAVDKRDVAGVQHLLEKGVDANMTGAKGETPLMRAVQTGNIAMINTLLHHGANVNAQDSDGVSALSWAVRDGRVDIVKLLLDKKAKIDVTVSGDMPSCHFSLLGWAVSNGNANIVKLLIGAGADVNEQVGGAMCSHYNSMLEAAKGNTEIVRMLKAAGAK